MTLLQIKKSKSTKKTRVTEFQCEFCGKSFQREPSLLNHACERKRRWQERDNPGNRIGFQTWLAFYARNMPSKKQKTYTDFANSSYYIAFVKFGQYCIDIRCLNVGRYSSWLLDNKISIDSWCSDVNYTKFIIDYMKDEDPLDAVSRSIQTTIDMEPITNVQCNDCLRFGNRNRLVHAITNGKISPWMLYQSASGIEFLEDLDESQQKMILDYINPEHWAVRFKRHADSVVQIKTLLAQAGY